MITLYGAPRSGHSYRVRMLLGFLGLAWRSVTMTATSRHEPEFLAKNALGQIPVLDDNGVVLADSNAILVYLARRYDPSNTWLPEDAEGQAHVQRWLSIAAGELVQGVVRPRGARLYGREIDLEAAKTVQKRVLDLVESHLGRHPFLSGDHPTIADLSIFSYLTVADEAGIDLAPYPLLSAWMRRIEALEGYVPIARE